jgi:serine/threonine protein kinase
MPADLKRVKEIFLEALEKPSAVEREQFLGEACAADEALRGQVDALLRQYEQGSDFLESQPSGAAQTVDSDHGGAAISQSPPVCQPGSFLEQPSTPTHAPSNELPGRFIDPRAIGAFTPSEGSASRIGPYRLLQKIGEGGMGVVYLAEQEEPVKRRVALKIIKAGMDSSRVLARFEAERQALAMMDHPNIARVLDAGTTEAGRPHFVMELVRGIPITKFCDQEHLTPKERLELFIPVCHAVQHAHQKGVIHRDIKPSNVLIGLYDGKPVPKVIDFGVAKATAQKLTERTMFTEVGQIVGTLEYMAPEQAELNNLDIDTRADIYSLGVILYELLTGSPPFTAQQLRSATLTEMLRMIREEEPPKPSAKLSSSDELLSIAARRKLEPKKLTKLVHGELDWIVMKCLEKERGRRYETASALAADVQRYLHDEPVQACPPSVAYKLRKYARKHRKAFLVAGGFAALLLLGIIVSTWQAVRATLAEQVAVYERDRAEENFMLAREAVDQSFTQISESPQLKAHGLEKLRLALLAQAKSYYERFVQAESGRAEVNAELGRAYLRLAEITADTGERHRAIEYYQRAREVFEQLAEQAPDETAYRDGLANVLSVLAENYRMVRWIPEAKSAWETAVSIREKLAGEQPESLTYRYRWAVSLRELGEFYSLEIDKNRSEQLLQKALSLCEALVQADPRNADYRYALARTLSALAYLQSWTNLQKEAEATFDKALNQYQALLHESPDVLEYLQWQGATYQDLASLLTNVRKPNEARRAVEKALTIRERLALEHPDVVRYSQELADTRVINAVTLAQLGDYVQASAQTDEALAKAPPGYELAYYNGACAYANCSVAASRDATLDLTDQHKFIERFAARAVALLRHAKNGGFFNGPNRLKAMQEDPDVDPLRSRDDFKKLLRELEKSAQAGSKSTRD